MKGTPKVASNKEGIKHGEPHAEKQGAKTLDKENENEVIHNQTICMEKHQVIEMNNCEQTIIIASSYK